MLSNFGAKYAIQFCLLSTKPADERSYQQCSQHNVLQNCQQSSYSNETLCKERHVCYCPVHFPTDMTWH